MVKEFDRIKDELNGISPEVCSKLYELARKDKERLNVIDNPDEQEWLSLSYCYYFLLSIKNNPDDQNENIQLKTELEKSRQVEVFAA